MTAVTERKRTKAEERAYSELHDLSSRSRAAELEKWNQLPRAQGAHAAARVGRDRARGAGPAAQVRVTTTYDEDLAKWFRAMGHGYQARMNAVLRAYMLAIKSREIASRQDQDWKGAEI